VLSSIFLRSWFTNNLRQPHTACNNSWWVRTYCGASQKHASCGVCENHGVLTPPLVEVILATESAAYLKFQPNICGTE
jgi:hypothetical protein